MNALKQAMWLFLTFMVLVISAWYYANWETHIKLDDETLSTTIDATVSNLTVRQFNKEGVLSNLLKTPLMQHIPKENIHLLQTPHISVAQVDQPSWEISSKKAKSFNGGQRIIFTKQVVVHQNQDNKTPESTLKTEKVIYFPKDKKATTDLFVTFEQPGNMIESTGMNAFLDEKRVELLHRARGSYAPSKG